MFETRTVLVVPPAARPSTTADHLSAELGAAANGTRLGEVRNDRMRSYKVM